MKTIEMGIDPGASYIGWFIYEMVVRGNDFFPRYLDSGMVVNPRLFTKMISVFAELESRIKRFGVQRMNVERLYEQKPDPEEVIPKTDAQRFYTTAEAGAHIAQWAQYGMCLNVHMSTVNFIRHTQCNFPAGISRAQATEMSIDLIWRLTGKKLTCEHEAAAGMAGIFGRAGRRIARFPNAELTPAQQKARAFINTLSSDPKGADILTAIQKMLHAA